MITTTISPSPHQPSSSSEPSPSPATTAIPLWIMDSFVFDEYSRKVSQVSQFVVESKFIEATQKLVEYGNREFLRSFQLRAEIINVKEQTSNNTNTINNINDISSSSLVAPFQTIGFLESKWLEVLKELVEYGNNNILGSFKLSLAVEEKGQENNTIAAVVVEVLPPSSNHNNHNQNGNGNNNNNQPWSTTRPRDKNGRFISSASYSTVAESTTTVGATAAITTQTSQTPSSSSTTEAALTTATPKPSAP